MLGAPRGTVLSEEDRKRVAYHEAGHAIVGMLTPGADPVRKVSIIPRGMALGVTLSAPDLDKANYEEEYLLTKIKVALGGRVAEEIVYGTITTGAESDIEQLTGIARAMVGRWGMSRRIGPIAVLPSEARGPLLPGTAEVVAGHAAADRPGGSADRRGEPPDGHGAADGAPREARVARRGAARATRRSTRTPPTAAARVDPHRAPAGRGPADRRGELLADRAPALDAGVAALEPLPGGVEQLAVGVR